MQNLVNQLNNLENANAAKPLERAQIILCQKELQQSDLAAIPADYLEILHHFNGYSCNSAFLYGISPLGNCFIDILSENTLIDYPTAADTIFLGHNEYDYLAYDQNSSCYQIIDKSDFMVLNTYNDCARAIRHILKIEDDI